MFAHNEAEGKRTSIEGVLFNIDKNLNTFIVIVNGCTDNTISLVKNPRSELKFGILCLVELALGDKCNAWNFYIHEMNEFVESHFFCDADVQFSKECFSTMHAELKRSKNRTAAVAGLSLSGRNKEYYQSMVRQRKLIKVAVPIETALVFGHELY